MIYLCHHKEKKDKQTSEPDLHWEFTVSSLFAIFNLWPLQLDCLCVLWMWGGWGLGAFGTWQHHGVVGTRHRH